MHAGSGPLIATVGAGLTVTVLQQAGLAVGHGGQVSARQIVNDPAPSAFTVTEVPVVEPTIVPFPLMLQLALHPAGTVAV